MIIVIAGRPGSGKSSVAKEVASLLSFPRISSGDFQREMAKERGISIVELAKLEAKDPSLDRLVDKRQEGYAKEHDNFVIDSWLGAKFIPQGIKIFLEGDESVRAKRIFLDSKNETRKDVDTYKTLEDAKRNMIERDRLNIERWIKYYDFDYTDIKNYDLVIDTTNLNLKEVVEIITDFIKTIG